MNPILSRNKSTSSMMARTLHFSFSWRVLVFACIAFALFAPLRVASTQSHLPQPDEICIDGRCYPRIFEPTHEFKEVLEGQEIPSGLHVRINFGTGLREAKLIDPTDPSPSGAVVIDESGSLVESEVAVVVDVAKNTSVPVEVKAVAKVAETVTPPGLPSQLEGAPIDPVETQVSLPYSFRKMKEMGDLLFSVGDSEVFEACLQVLGDPNTTIDDLIQALEGLEELVHQIDFGVRFVEEGGLSIVLSLAQDGETTDIRAAAAAIIGAALQNNPTAQNEALAFELSKRLLVLLSKEPELRVLPRLLFALSSFTRGNSRATATFLDSDGWGLRTLALSGVIKRSDEALRKVSILLTDALDPAMQPQNAQNASNFKVDKGAQTVFGVEEEDRLSPELQKELGGWCQELREATMERELDLDTKEKVCGAVWGLRRWCHQSDAFEKWVAKERKIVDPEFEEYAAILEKLTDRE